MRARATTIPTLVLVISALAAGCGGGSSSTGGTGTAGAGSGLPAGCHQVPRPKPKHVKLKPPPKPSGPLPHTATVNTSCGTFQIALDDKGQPKTVNSFAYLVGHRFYDGLAFHRIVPGFVIQGGDPLGNGIGGPGYTVTEPPRQNTSYLRGVVAMAKTSAQPPGASGSQFFVVTAPADAGLPPVYAVLGKVSSGMGAVARIAKLANPALGPTGGEPVQPVVIASITVH